jgi:L-histidine N-alpha-methyltransferase
MSPQHAVLDIHLTDRDAAAALRADARAGLTASPKHLPPRWFYDARGSALFEEITALPEYYPTRTEAALLARSVDEIAVASGADTLVELGSGSSAKTRLLLDALARAGTLRRYVPQDVSEAALRGALDELAAAYPGVALHGVVGDFTADLDKLPGGDRRMVAFLGGTIGNLVPAERAAFLSALRAVLEPGETLLLGTGLVIDEATLVAAYDDAAGVTAAFNRNVLHVLNRELDADFDVDAFAHQGAVGRPARVDRDAAGGAARDDRARRGAGPGRGVRGGGGDAHRDLGQVPPGRGAGVAGGHRLGGPPHLDRPGRALRADARRRRLIPDRGRARFGDVVPPAVEPARSHVFTGRSSVPQRRGRLP